MQIADQFTALGTKMQLRIAIVVGGADMMAQSLQLAERPHVVIGTPGRLADHLRSSAATARIFSNLRFLVIVIPLILPRPLSPSSSTSSFFLKLVLICTIPISRSPIGDRLRARALQPQRDQ